MTDNLLCKSEQTKKKSVLIGFATSGIAIKRVEIRLSLRKMWSISQDHFQCVDIQSNQPGFEFL